MMVSLGCLFPFPLKPCPVDCAKDNGCAGCAEHGEKNVGHRSRILSQSRVGVDRMRAGGESC